MTCPKCGGNNIDGSSFCIKCGGNLKEIQTVGMTNESMMQQEQNVNFQQPINNQQPISNTNVSTVQLNYLMYVITILLRPFKSFKDEETKLNDVKTTFILTLIITGAMTVIKLITTIITAVHVKSFSLKGYEYSWEWSNLKGIKWIEVIGKNFLIYGCIILAIAIVFYIGSLIIKKELSFIKSLAISATSAIPAVIGIMVLSPLAGKIWIHLGTVCMVVGAVYSLVILYELMNDELKLDSDIKIYFNLGCLGILFVAGYYVYMKLFMSTVTSGLDSIMNFLK